MRKKILSLLLVFMASCSNKPSNNSLLSSLPPPPPPPKEFPSTTPPSFIPIDSEIQINSIPHPFNLNGNMPYAVWVDGKRLILDMKETQSLAKSLNIKFTQPKDTAEIHSGEGWQRPFKVDPQKSDIQQFFEEEEVFIDVE